MENKDVILLGMIKVANKTDIGMGLTLNVKGTLVTGELISYERYLSETSDAFKGKGEVGDVISESFSKMALEHKKYIEENPDVAPNLIHLKNAKIFNGNKIFNLGLWRGRLENIDGFTFGSLNDN